MSLGNRRARRGGLRSRRTPARPTGSGGSRIPWVPLAIVAGIAIVAGLVVFLIIQSGQSPSSGLDDDQRVEANDDPALPGEWVNLPEIYGDESGLAQYGGRDGPNTAPHVSRDVDYAEEQGLPPVGGPHWGNGACPSDPDDAPAFCGPVLPGIYRSPWPAESLVHTLEHAGVVVWYNTTDQSIIDELEDFARDNDDKNLVLTPYPEMEEEHVAITVWSRRDKFPVSEFDRERLQAFLDELYCDFDPEDFC